MGQIMTDNEENENLNNKFRRLAMKNAICSIQGALSTITLPLLWRQTDLVCWLYLDLLLNSVVIGLMDFRNEWLYQCICRPCIGCVRVRLLIMQSPAWQKITSISPDARFTGLGLGGTLSNNPDFDNESSESESDSPL